MGILKLLVSIFLLVFTFQKPQKTWVAIGDSITYINEHLAETDNRVKKGYMTQVVNKLPYLSYTNKGYNGWTVLRIAEKWETLGIPKADIYTVFLGTNDWWVGNLIGDLSETDANKRTVVLAYKNIISNIKNINPEAKIILIGPMKRVDFVYYKNYKNNAFGSYHPKNGQMLHEFNDAFINLAKSENLSYIDLFNEKKLDYKHLVKYKLVEDNNGISHRLKFPNFDEVAFDPNSALYPYPKSAAKMTYDGLHPSDKGYEVISNLLVSVLEKLE